jgi:hypothetical protein
MVIKSALIIMVILILMEDGSSIKKTEEEKREDEELARVVNATLEAEEEKKRKEEEGEVKKKKKKEDGTKEKRTGDVTKDKEKKDVENKDEACPPANFSCPIVQPCSPCKNCEACEDCPKCGPCPRCEDPEECPPVLPCPADNDTRRGQELSTPPSCPELPSMSVPVALVTGATVSLLTVSAAAVLGLVLRYVPPLISGFLFLVLILMVWFLSSRYPEVAREMGARAWTIMQEATSALSHRIMEAIRHRDNQVGYS